MAGDRSNLREQDKKQRYAYDDSPEPPSRRHRRRHYRRDRDSEKESLRKKSLSRTKPRPTHHQFSDSTYSPSRSDFVRSESSDGVSHLLKKERTSDRPIKGKERIKNHSPKRLNPRFKENDIKNLQDEGSCSSEFLSCDEDDSVSDDDVSGQKIVLARHKSENEVSKNKTKYKIHLESELFKTKLHMEKSTYTESRPRTSYSHEGHDACIRSRYQSESHIYEQPRYMKLEKENKRVKRTFWVVAPFLVLFVSVLSFGKW